MSVYYKVYESLQLAVERALNMGRTIRAKFSKGLIKPLEKLDLEESEDITVTVGGVPQRKLKYYLAVLISLLIAFSLFREQILLPLRAILNPLSKLECDINHLPLQQYETFVGKNNHFSFTTYLQFVLLRNIGKDLEKIDIYFYLPEWGNFKFLGVYPVKLFKLPYIPPKEKIPISILRYKELVEEEVSKNKQIQQADKILFTTPPSEVKKEVFKTFDYTERESIELLKSGWAVIFAVNMFTRTEKEVYSSEFLNIIVKKENKQLPLKFVDLKNKKGNIAN